jgi:hypothetical protein
MAKLLAVWYFKGAEKVVSFCFWFVFLFCMLMQKDLGELVSMMECDPGYSMEIFYELCESRLYERIGEEISGERRDKGYI